MTIVARCVGRCKQPTGSELGMGILSCTHGCKIVWISASGTGLQVVISFVNKWGAAGERTGNDRGERVKKGTGVGE